MRAAIPADISTKASLPGQPATTTVSRRAGVVISGAWLPSSQILVSQAGKAGTTSTVQAGNRHLIPQQFQHKETQQDQQNQIKQGLALSNSSAVGASKLTVAGSVQGTAARVEVIAGQAAGGEGEGLSQLNVRDSAAAKWRPAAPLKTATARRTGDHTAETESG